MHTDYPAKWTSQLEGRWTYLHGIDTLDGHGSCAVLTQQIFLYLAEAPGLGRGCPLSSKNVNEPI